MNSTSKPLMLTFTVLLLSSLFVLTVTPVNVQAASKPTVPEFTLKIVDHSYTEPSTQSTDPYTGKTTTHPGHYVENKVIEITIKNQNYQSKIMYNVRTKGHFEQQWIERGPSVTVNGMGRSYDPPPQYPEQTKGQYTVITLGPVVDRNDPYSYYFNMPDSGQVDVQVEAMSGTFSWKDDINMVMAGAGTGYYVFDGEKSGWSKTQTVTINKNTNEITTTHNDNSETSPDTNQPTGFSWIELGCIIIITAILSVTITFFILKRTVNRKNA